MKKAIITGAGGFIGYALTKRLLEENVEVYAIIRSYKEQWREYEKLSACHVIICDMNEIDSLINLISERIFDVFYHLAWQGVSTEESNNLDIQLTNVRNTAKAVETAKMLECKKFVFASSIMEYELEKLMKTKLPAGKRNIYRAAKKMATAVARIYCNDHSIEFCTALITNVYGPGEFTNRFIITTLRKMCKNEKILLSEAKQLYDFCFIDDAVSILFLIGKNGKNNCSYYVGEAVPKPLKEYIMQMKESVEGEMELVFGANEDFIGISLNYDEFDIHSSEKEFNYKCKVSFEEGIKRTIMWLKSIEVTYENN